MATRCWYARYPTGYLDSEMDSLKSVDEKKSVHSTSAGAKGSKDVQEASEEDARAGDSGARIGNSVTMNWHKPLGTNQVS